MEPLYLKYRPKNFDEIIGQDEITRTISNSIKCNKVLNSYLFYGPRGCGKTSTARILAKVLNCHNRLGINPCNECISCIEISNSSSIDVMEIDAASHTQVQNIRDVIIDSVRLSPARDKYKIYILDEVHMLSTSAFNALLKTIEEPPPHAVFILATTEINKVPITIVSRCQTFRFKPVNDDTIIKRLEYVCKKEGIEYDIKTLSLISSASGGAMRDALGLLEKISSFCNGKINIEKAREILGYPKEEIIFKLAYAILKRSISEINTTFEEIRREGYDVFAVLKELRDCFSKTFLSINGLYQGYDVLKDDMDANQFIYPKLARKINKIIDEIRYSDNPIILAETFIYTLIDFIDLDELVKRVEQTESKTDTVLAKENQSPNVITKGQQITYSQDVWKKILNYFLKENYFIYNTLISVKIKFDSDKLLIIPSSDIEKDIILNNIDIIKKVAMEYNLNLIIEDKKKIESDLFIKKDIGQDNNVFFPEYERIKKVFGETIVRVIKNEVSSKTDK